jgi:peptidoglycan/LPS O-acetylase OafA/YrhL
VFLAQAPHAPYWPHAAMPVACGLLMVAALRSLVLRKFFANRWIATIGGMCYSIYLLHFIFIAAIFKVTRHAIVHSAVFPVNLAIQLLVTVLPAVLLCALFFRLVERPCMDPDWHSKLWHWATGRPARELQALDSAGIAE